MRLDLDRARYVLRLTWRARKGHVLQPRSVAGCATLLRYLGFAVEKTCEGHDHVSFRLRPPDANDLPLGEALARLETWEAEALADAPGEHWSVSVELPCPRRTTAFDALPACDEGAGETASGPGLAAA